MTSDNNQDRPFLAYLAAQPRYSNPPKWFPGMGQTPKPPRVTTQDSYLWKRRDRS